jgi:Methylamine utilisation protein MauE
MQYVAIGCRAALVIVFLIAVTGKVAGRGSFREFTDSIVAMRVIPTHAARLAASASVTAEALVVVLAASPFKVPAIAGCALAGLLSITFSAAIAVSLRRGNRAPCRCFGRSATPLGARHLARNVILLAVSVAGTAASLGTGGVHAAAAVVAAGAGLFAGIAIAAYDEISELLVPSH